MGHISLGALCLLPDYKRYLALYLQEIPYNKDNIGIWSLCWIGYMLSSVVKTPIVVMQLAKNKTDYSRGYIWLLFLHRRNKRMRLNRIALNLSATVFVEIEIPLRCCLYCVYGLDSGVCVCVCLCCAHWGSICWFSTSLIFHSVKFALPTGHLFLLSGWICLSKDINNHKQSHESCTSPSSYPSRYPSAVSHTTVLLFAEYTQSTYFNM